MSDTTAAIIKFGLFCCVTGWGVIEFACWFFSHLSWSWS